MGFKVVKRLVDEMFAHLSVAQVLLHVLRKVTLISRGGKMRQYEQAGHMFCKSYVPLVKRALVTCNVLGANSLEGATFTRLKELWLCANLSEPNGYGVQIQRRVGAGSNNKRLKLLLIWG